MIALRGNMKNESLSSDREPIESSVAIASTTHNLADRDAEKLRFHISFLCRRQRR